MAKEYVFRVKPQGYRNNYRVIRIGGGRTLHDLHLAILDAYDFYADHLYMFSPDMSPLFLRCPVSGTRSTTR